MNLFHCARPSPPRSPSHFITYTVRVREGENEREREIEGERERESDNTNIQKIIIRDN